MYYIKKKYAVWFENFYAYSISGVTFHMNMKMFTLHMHTTIVQNNVQSQKHCVQMYNRRSTGAFVKAHVVAIA